MTDDTAAIARLTAQMEHLMAAVSHLTEEMATVRSQLDQARGGASVLRWVIGGNLAAFIGVAGAVYAWLVRTAH